MEEEEDEKGEMGDDDKFVDGGGSVKEERLESE